MLEIRAQEETAFRQVIDKLGREVAGKEKEKQEASQKIERLQTQQNLKEEQSLELQRQLAKTETEAKEWEARYQKLDAKVKSFVNDI